MGKRNSLKTTLSFRGKRSDKKSHRTESLAMEIFQSLYSFEMRVNLYFYSMSHDHNYFVYFMVNKHKNVLYLGVTNDLERRVYEHETSEFKGFTKKYNCHYLVHYEHFTHIEHAIDRRRKLKNGAVRRKPN